VVGGERGMGGMLPEDQRIAPYMSQKERWGSKGEKEERLTRRRNG